MYYTFSYLKSERRRLYFLNDREKEGTHSVFGCCFSFSAGLGAVGRCDHITAVLWNLLCAKHLTEIPKPADFLEEIGMELEE